MAPIRSIAVIGAGPSGAAIAKALLKEKTFETIKVFERRKEFGGLWNYCSETDPVPVPSEKPYRVEPIIEGNKVIWPTPAYELLDTNVPKDVMTYGSLQFPDSLPIFPHRSDVNVYMHEYAEEIRPITQFNAAVVLVIRTSDKWSVISRTVNPELFNGSILSEKDVTETFDAVAIAVGNYDVPYLPLKSGIVNWNKEYPGSISHVKTFKSPKEFEKHAGNIVVVGNSASAADICFQIAEGLQRTVIKSKRSANQMPASPSDKIIERPDIDYLDAELRTVYYVDGTKTENVDRIIFATGYLKSFPFLENLDQSNAPIVTNGQMVHGTYQHVILYNYPNLAVLGLPKFVLPARTSESQACWLAQVWSGRISLPTKSEMVEWENSRLQEKGSGKKFHDLNFPEDVRYCNQLNKMVFDNINRSGIGLRPKAWDKHQTKIRASMKHIKEAYVMFRTAKGRVASNYEELREVYPHCMVDDKALEDLGFKFDN